jgi:hypothetical protein
MSCLLFVNDEEAHKKINIDEGTTCTNIDTIIFATSRNLVAV